MIAERKKTEKFLIALTTWAKKNMRDYPWRRLNDPYKILVAEIMLQRTKSDQVVPVYEDFIKNYPSPKAIANASLKDIKASIRSLGLMKRAAGLKTMAKQIVKEYCGEVPRERKQLLALFGVGDYIADAIMCHAYGVGVLTVDANLARVFKRVFSLQTRTVPQKDKSVRLFAKEILTFAGNNCRELNLTMIDLANLICTPKNPKCPECPLSSICNYVLEVQE
jgi:A/G-specific adenine glycosylase